jgi:hypothetical protein
VVIVDAGGGTIDISAYSRVSDDEDNASGHLFTEISEAQCMSINHIDEPKLSSARNRLPQRLGLCFARGEAIFER